MNKSTTEMSRADFLKIPKRKWNDILTGVCGVYIIPSGRKHESGFACMDMVAEFSDKRPMVRFGGSCDDIELDGKHFRIDCLYPHRILHIWSWIDFTITYDISSIMFIKENNK